MRLSITVALLAASTALAGTIDRPSTIRNAEGLRGSHFDKRECKSFYDSCRTGTTSLRVLDDGEVHVFASNCNMPSIGSPTRRTTHTGGEIDALGNWPPRRRATNAEEKANPLGGWPPVRRDTQPYEKGDILGGWPPVRRAYKIDDEAPPQRWPPATRPAFINLGECLGNNNGNLVTGGNLFHKSCRDFELNGPTVFTATCADDRGALRRTSIDLDHVLCSRSGYLSC